VRDVDTRHEQSATRPPSLRQEVVRPTVSACACCARFETPRRVCTAALHSPQECNRQEAELT